MIMFHDVVAQAPYKPMKLNYKFRTHERFVNPHISNSTIDIGLMGVSSTHIQQIFNTNIHHTSTVHPSDRVYKNSKFNTNIYEFSPAHPLEKDYNIVTNRCF